MNAQTVALEQATIRQYCKQLRTPTIGAQFEKMAEEAVKQKQSHVRYLEVLLGAEVEEREFRLAVRRGEFVGVEQVRSDWTKVVSQATSLLRRKFEQELPPVLSGLDATGIQGECRKAIDEVLAILHGS